jgi:hypothetical protein
VPKQIVPVTYGCRAGKGHEFDGLRKDFSFGRGRGTDRPSATFLGTRSSSTAAERTRRIRPCVAATVASPDPLSSQVGVEASKPRPGDVAQRHRAKALFQIPRVGTLVERHGCRLQNGRFDEVSEQLPERDLRTVRIEGLPAVEFALNLVLKFQSITVALHRAGGSPPARVSPSLPVCRARPSL